MNDETNNEPKSLAEMTKEDLLAEYFDADINHTLPEWQKIRAEVLRRMEAGEELATEAERLKEKLTHCCGDAHQELAVALDWIGQLGFVKERQGKGTEVWRNARAESAEAEVRRLREAASELLKTRRETEATGRLGLVYIDDEKLTALTTPEAGKEETK